MFVLALLCLLATGGQAKDRGLGDLRVGQLRDLIRSVVEEVVREVMAESRTTEAPKEAVALHPNCTDTNIYNGCELVVTYGLCTKADYYARYCCRSCTLANHLPLYGPHLANTAEAPVSANVTADSGTDVQLGSEVRLKCVTSGYPEPDVAWFKGNRLLGPSEKYVVSVSAALNPLVQRVNHALIIKDFEPEDADVYTCVGVNQAGKNTSSVYLSAEAPIQATTIMEEQLYPAGVNVTMTCRAKGYSTPHVSWLKDYQQIPDTEKYVRGENGSVNMLLTTVEDTLTIRAVNESDSGTYTCNATNQAGTQTSSVKVMVRDVTIHENCTDVINSNDCLKALGSECSVKDYIARFCCRTCTLLEFIPLSGPHLLNTAKAPLSVDLRLSGGNSYWKFSWGSDVSISCTSGSLLKPRVHWYKNGQLIEESDKYEVQVSEEKVWVRHFVKSQLTVKSLRVRDTGRYTCRAVIPATTEERHATLVFEQDGLLSFRERFR